MQELIFSALKKFGLTENETKVYLETLKHAELSPFQIAKQTKIARTTVYDILMTLSLKGLVELEQSDGFTKQQTKVRAKNPSVLRNILQKKRQELIETEADILNILPTIKQDFHRNMSNADFRFYPGLEGAKKVYMEALNFDAIDKHETIRAWDIQMPMDFLGIDETNTDVDKSTKLRLKRVGLTKEILPLNAWTKHVLTYQVERDPKYLENCEYRTIEPGEFGIYTRIQIAGNYIWFVCTHENEMWGLIIKSKFLALTLSAVFEQNWQTATPVTKKIVESWGKNEFIPALKKKRK